MLQPNPMSVQVAPWSKTGGLGDVCGSLPPALAARGHRVMVVAPQYQNYPEASSTGVSILTGFVPYVLRLLPSLSAGYIVQYMDIRILLLRIRAMQC